MADQEAQRVEQSLRARKEWQVQLVATLRGVEGLTFGNRSTPIRKQEPRVSERLRLREFATEVGIGSLGPQRLGAELV